MAIFRCTGLVVLAMSTLCGGELTGHAIVTKRLTKKAPSAAPYNLRGVSAPAASDKPETEFDRMVVILEGASKLPSKPPETLVI